jgi:outer membrane biogenesis lipoprotein LolB
MKHLVLALALTVLTGCSTIKDYIPVKWDSNQSSSITSIQMTTRNFDCKGDIATQAKTLQQQVEWLKLYSESKPTRDVIAPIGLMNDSVKELVDRTSKGSVSVMYCEMKKKIVIKQADIVAHTIHGRLF